MAHTIYNPLHKGWETILKERFDLYRELSYSGDTGKVDFILLRDQLDHEDHYRTVIDTGMRQNLTLAVKTADGMEKLHTLANNGAKTTQEICGQVHNQMKELKDSPNGKKKENWEKFLEETINKRKGETDKMWNKMYVDAHATIEAMPPALQTPATHVFNIATGGITRFITSALEWLTDAFKSVVQWLSNAIRKIGEFAGKVVTWFTSAWNWIQDKFSGKKTAKHFVDGLTDSDDSYFISYRVDSDSHRVDSDSHRVDSDSHRVGFHSHDGDGR
ncbi:hypothetical protein MY4824_009461 [Beauveria thailandica]